MSSCSVHPENERFYHDSLHKTELCFGCVWDWFGNNRMAKRNDPGRITFSAPGYIDVGNFNSGQDFRWKYDCVINVSDTMTGHEDFWFPINEVTAWGYSPFFWFKKIMDHHDRGRTLVHCHAGIHRSLMMAYCWMLSIGFDECEAEKLFNSPSFNIRNDYTHDKENGFIPDDLLQFYKIIEEHPRWSLAGVLRDLGVPNLLNNTSLRENTKYQDYQKKTL